MKNKDLFELRKSLNEVDNVKGKIFAYSVFKNKQILDKEIEAILFTKNDPHPDYLNFENERTLLCQEYAEKNENGEPIIQHNPNGSQAYKIKDMEKFNEEYKKLSEKYKDVLNDMQEAKEEYDKLLEKETNIELEKISLDDLPDDINSNFLEKIKYILED